MQEVNIGKYTLNIYTTQEYIQEFDAEVEEELCAEITHIAWLEIRDKNEIVEMSCESMYIFADNTYAYSKRGVLCKATFQECLEVIGWMEKIG